MASNTSQVQRTAIAIVILAGASCAGFNVRQDPNEPCAFRPAENLGPGVNGPLFEGSPTVSADEKTLLFTSSRAENGQQDLFVSTRGRTGEAWGKPVNLGPPVDDPTAGDFALRLSLDDQALYFSSNRQGGFGSSDVYVARRKSANHPWGPPENLGPLINTEAYEAFPTPSADGNTLYFNRSTTFDSPDSDIWATSRTNEHEPWGAAQRLAEPVNGPGAEFSPWIAPSGLTLFFASNRPGNIGVVDIWVARRSSTSASWKAPHNLGPNVNTPSAWTLGPFMSANQRRLYFMSTRRGELGGPDCGFINCFDLYLTTCM